MQEFADYLGVSKSTVSTWWNETRIPEGENILKIAMKLGIEVFDVLDIERPDEDLLYLQQVWNDLPATIHKDHTLKINWK